MIPAKIAGLRANHSRESAIVTAIKSAPKNTFVTPSICNNRLANGDDLAKLISAKSAVPCYITGTPGINFNVAGFGVS